MENSTPSLSQLRTESWQTTDVSLLVYTDKRGGERAAGVGVYYDMCKQNRNCKTMRAKQSSTEYSAGWAQKRLSSRTSASEGERPGDSKE